MKKRFTVQRIAMDAVMVALYFGLSMISITIGGLKFTVESLPVVICAVAFGPIDAAIVGFLGETMNQMLTYGFTPTTALWVLPYVVQGLFIGTCVLAMKKRLSADALAKTKRSVLLFVVCIIAGILISCLNTLALYIDSKMFGYYSYAMVFGVFWIRIATGVITACAMAAVVQPLVLALKRAKFIQ